MHQLNNNILKNRKVRIKFYRQTWVSRTNHYTGECLTKGLEINFLKGLYMKNERGFRMKPENLRR